MKKYLVPVFLLCVLFSLVVLQANYGCEPVDQKEICQ